MEIAFDDRISTIESESSCNRRPNSLESNFKLTMIQFGGPNRLSLPACPVWYTPASNEGIYNIMVSLLVMQLT